MNYYEHFIETIDKVVFQEEVGLYNCIEALVPIFINCKQNKHTLFFIGNGGSAGIAVHMTSDFLKNGKMKTHSMHDPAIVTCLANDYGYEFVFSKQIELVAEKGDLLIAISSSGESLNILNAAQSARKKECKIVTFSGFSPDNKLRQLGDFNVYVPSMEYGVVESIHNLILQYVVDTCIECYK